MITWERLRHLKSVVDRHPWTTDDRAGMEELFTMMQAFISRDFEVGPLRVAGGSVLWRGRDVRLPPSGYELVRLLALRAGIFIDLRDIQAYLRPDVKYIGKGEDGFKTNVRSCVKRTRRAFLAVDPSFDEIEVASTRGYRWKVPAIDDSVVGRLLDGLQAPEIAR